MAQLWFSDVQLWTGEFARERVVRNGYHGINGSVQVRGVMNLDPAEDSSGDELLWRGDLEGIVESEVSSASTSGSAFAEFRTGGLLGITAGGYRLDFGDQYCSEPQFKIELSGAFDESTWQEGAIDVFTTFATDPDLAWIDPSIRLKLGPMLGICLVVKLPALPRVTSSSDDDRNREAWILYPDPADGPWTMDELADHKPWSLWAGFNNPPLMVDAANGASHSSGDPHTPGAGPSPHPGPRGSRDEERIAPEVTATVAYSIGAGVVQFTSSCPAWQQSGQDQAPFLLEEPDTLEAAAAGLGGRLCGQCARILAARSSPILFASEDGALVLYGDRMEHRPSGLVLHYRDIRYHPVLAILGGALRIANDAVTIDVSLASRSERDLAVEVLQNANVPKF